MSSAPYVLRYADENELAGEVSKHLVNTLAQAQAERGAAHLCLCGGRAERMVCGHLASLARSGSINPAGLHLWWSSEAFVTTADPSRNSLATLGVLGGALAVPPANIHAMPSSNGSADPDDAAYIYAKELGETVFDICLLELGLGGRVASIFPRHPSFTMQSSLNLLAIGVTDAPEGPPEQITLTYNAINRSRHIWGLASGAAIAGCLADTLRGDPRTPAAQVRGTDQTIWFVDRASAEQVPYFQCDL
ncbi:6-phosphogluconolactonase [Propionibacterium australiense]|uniref:6-phosphogluconolactonase n=1 Tax=Propionibacterium australiense TaxID=119981 RepID=A0A383S576_9ACTN|nr:6-phosphogluconolactonase [Propionibacterium australiense]RLP11126.1 6-phosphogluconolactonase [Propionibacterium australiense]RLP12453.1 6-phosphogluconolactonase [Propionibacterium australiense]SYZ32732.1 6-phosphogluconolactonase [Propionibacterium australiense]VEH91454.1 6-phosphogluconolactonase [Propionibacterium australiense]